MEKHLVIAVPVIESERGWGSKIDDYMVCLSMEDAKAFAKKFNSENTEDTAPDWYMRADDVDAKPIDISDKQFKVLKKEKDKRMWLSQLKK